MTFDRLKAAFNALVVAAIPRWRYAAPRFARVVKSVTASDGSTKLDVVPDDPDFPPMAGVPLFHGLPGTSLTLTAGTRVLVEFSEADPAGGFVRSWAGGEVVASLSLGGAGAVALVLEPLLAPYLTAISTHVHPETGGTTLASPTLATVPPVAAAVVKGK